MSCAACCVCVSAFRYCGAVTSGLYRFKGHEIGEGDWSLETGEGSHRDLSDALSFTIDDTRIRKFSKDCVAAAGDGIFVSANSLIST